MPDEDRELMKRDGDGHAERAADKEPEEQPVKLNLCIRT